MKKGLKRALFWTPRILCILYAAFLSLFALDVLVEGAGTVETIIALLMHLIPVFAVLAVLLAAWRREWVGAVLFNALAVLYIVMTRGQFHWSVYLSICGPLVLIGILFQFNWRYREQLKAR